MQVAEIHLAREKNAYGLYWSFILATGVNLSILTGWEPQRRETDQLAVMQAPPWPHLAAKCPTSTSPAAQQSPEESPWPAADAYHMEGERNADEYYVASIFDKCLLNVFL